MYLGTATIRAVLYGLVSIGTIATSKWARIRTKRVGTALGPSKV